MCILASILSEVRINDQIFLFPCFYSSLSGTISNTRFYLFRSAAELPAWQRSCGSNPKLDTALAIHFILVQKVTGHGHRVTEYKKILKAIEWPA